MSALAKPRRRRSLRTIDVPAQTAGCSGQLTDAERLQWSAAGREIASAHAVSAVSCAGTLAAEPSPMSSIRSASVVIATMLSGCLTSDDPGSNTDESILGSDDSDDKADDAAVTCDGVAWQTEWDEFEREVVRLTNQERRAGATCGDRVHAPVRALYRNAKLTCAARGHSTDMVERDFFAHQRPGGPAPDERMRAAGYFASYVGENIAAGQQTPAEVVAGWMASPGHCRNIMNGDFQDLGVGFHGGVIAHADGDITGAWTQDFGGY